MKNIFWRDAAKSGLIIGVIVLAVLYIKTWLAISGSGEMGFLFTLIEFVVVAYCIYMFSKQRSMLYDSSTGYSFGQNMSFILAVMVFAGFIYGIGYYLLINFIATDFYAESLDMAFDMMYNMLGDMAEQNIDAAMQLMKNPFYWLFYGMTTMIIQGGIIGLFVSTFVKRKPDIFINNRPEDE